MDSAWLVPVALAFGLVVGAAGTVAIVVAHRRGQHAVAVVSPGLPDGVDEVIDALESAGVVIDSSNNVIKASTGALAFGLVWNQALVHQPLIDLVDRVRRDGTPVSQELDVARGPFGEAQLHLLVRVARLGNRFVLLLADDRTEAHRLDDVRRDFVANVSHELKTPIGAVSLLAAALASASDEPDEFRRFAKRLTQESERLANITAEIIELVDQVRRDGTPVSQELNLARGPFGEAQLHLLVRVARLGNRFVLLLADDRTEAHRLDDVRRDFVANVSHELKTPIGAVSLLAEALASASDEPDEVQRFAKRLTKESERLANITAEIIELSRLQSGDPLTSAERVSIDSVIAQAVDRNRVAAESHRISLVASGNVRAKVFGDQQLLVTAVHNLIANAIQYSPDGSRIGVGVRADNGVVEISVTDQGVGIPEDERDRVFERFFRVDAARSRNTGGSGLGLAIVKHVVQNHGGDVRVWSQLGHGSTFTIRLPEASHAAATSLGASQ